MHFCTTFYKISLLKGQYVIVFTFFVFFVKKQKKAQTKHSKFNAFHFVKTGYQVAKFVMFLPLTFCNVKSTST